MDVTVTIGKVRFVWSDKQKNKDIVSVLVPSRKKTAVSINEVEKAVNLIQFASKEL